MTVLPLLSFAWNGQSGDMDTFLTILALIVLFVLLALPPLIWHLKDRAIDRQLRRAEHPEPPAARSPTSARAPRRLHRPRTTAGQAH